MAIKVRSTEVYSYDVSRFLVYVCDFDGVLPVLLGYNLTVVTLTNDPFDHTVLGWKPILSSYHLLCLGHSHMSKVVCSLDDLSL